jgi:mutator family transposase
VIQEAWVSGVSTRRVDELVQAMGLAGIGKSTVSKLCKEIDNRVGTFLDPLRRLATCCAGGTFAAFARWKASGRISGLTPPTSSSAKAGASSRWRR